MSSEPSSNFGHRDVPWDGVRALSRFWSGAGQLFDWPVSDEWGVAIRWSIEETRARATYALLLRFRDTVLPYLPQTPSQWLDLLEQELGRIQVLTEVPTAHTDWIATVSEFGLYRAPLYVERRPHGTFDTALIRTLKWFCRAVIQAADMVRRVLDQRPLTDAHRTSLNHALELPEVQGAADEEDLEFGDAVACTEAGGAWALIGASSLELASLWYGSLATQLRLLVPILPQLDWLLFELGVLGEAATVVQDSDPSALWHTSTPIAAAEAGQPCLTANSVEHSWNFYYQTVPNGMSKPDSPYRVLSAPLHGGILRPDIWIIQDGSPRAEVIVECKFSLDRSYVADGIPQVLAYWLEYPPTEATTRVHMVVCPDQLVDQPSSWSEQFVIGTPTHLRALISALQEGSLIQLLETWAGD